MALISTVNLNCLAASIISIILYSIVTDCNTALSKKIVWIHLLNDFYVMPM